MDDSKRKAKAEEIEKRGGKEIRFTKEPCLRVGCLGHLAYFVFVC